MTDELSPEYKLKSYITNPAHHLKTGAIKAFFLRADMIAIDPTPADSRQGVINIMQFYGLEPPENVLNVFISEYEAARPNVPKWKGRQAAPVIPGNLPPVPFHAEPNPEKAESLEHSHGSQASDRPQGLERVQAGDFSGLAGWDLQANEQRGNTEGPADPGTIKEIENIANRINNMYIFFFLWIEAAYKFPGLIDTWNKAIKTEKNQFIKSIMIMALIMQNVPQAKSEILESVLKLAGVLKLLNDFKNKKEPELLTALQVLKGLAKEEIKAIKTIKSEYRQIIQVFKLKKSPELRQKAKTLFELSIEDFKNSFPFYGLQADLLIYLTMAAHSTGFISLCQTIKDLLDVNIPADKETEINDTLAALYPSYLLPELGKPKAALNYELGRDLLTKELFFPAKRAARQIKADPRQGLFKFMFLFPTKKIKTGTAEISILFDVSGLAALPPEERRINEYDALIHNVISSIYNAGNEVISINQIYEKMGYSRDTMTKEARAAIIKSIDKMRKTDIMASRTDGDIKAFPGGFQSYRGAILQAEYFTGHRNGKIIDCVRIARQPILNQIPKERNMMYYVSFDLLKFPYHFTNENIRLWHILVQRLGLMKHKGQNLLSLDTLFKECGITGKEKRRQTKKKIIKTLELFSKGGGNAECDILQGFTEIEAEGGGTAFKIDFKKDCQ